MPKKFELTKLQKDVLNFFGQNKFGKKFYWTGGTLLSYYYLNHRFSEDLDFFSNDLFGDDEYLNFINQLKNEIRANQVTFKLDKNRRLYLIKRGRENVKLELVYFPFINIGKVKKLKEFGLKIDSLSDILTNKILSAYERQEVKDVYDLYFYLVGKPKNDFLKLINLCEKKFGVKIEPILVLTKINQLLDNLGQLKPLLVSLHKNLKGEMKIFFQEIFNSLSKRFIK